MNNDDEGLLHSTRAAPFSIAVIGGGMSGLICARKLTEHQCAVTVFDKGRAPGGRMATRHIDGYQFDHGAQYFSVRDPRFQRDVDTWQLAGLVAEWNGRVCALEHGIVSASDKVSKRYVGVPGMSAIAQHLAMRCNLLSGICVAPIQREGQQWRLTTHTGENLGSYDVVVAAVPAPQAVELLGEATSWTPRVASVQMSGCWAVMLGFSQPLELQFDGAFVHDSVLSWVARDSSKPGRSKLDCWVLHGAPGWSDAHRDDDPEQVIEHLLDAFYQATAHSAARSPVFARAHRWRYALPTAPLPESCLFDPMLRIGMCGDWCAGPRVEGAWLSGEALAEQILSSLFETVS
jgi:renalase